MSFAKHETFHIREGWLFKGMAAIIEAQAHGGPPTVFLDKDSPERLGIGRNMVRSLRFWIQATGLAQEEREQGKTVHTLTPFGQWVWEFDRYLEDETTLWLIHYHLVSQPEIATTWYWFFNHFIPIGFTQNDTFQALRNWVVTQYKDQKIADSSLKKDISCLLRTYLPEQKEATPEDLTESPFARLGILSSVGGKRSASYTRLPLDTSRLSPLVFLYVLMTRQSQNRPGTNQVALTQALREPMNVGRVFNLNTGALSNLLEILEHSHPDFSVRLIRTAGLDQLNLPAVSADDILNRLANENIAVSEVV